MAMGIFRQRSLSGGELGREIPSAVRGTVQLPFKLMNMRINLFIINNLMLTFLSKVKRKTMDN
ncbi:hypothetical protein Hanom_Chr01g00003401 [Helianthus anomalus]